MGMRLMNNHAKSCWVKMGMAMGCEELEAQTCSADPHLAVCLVSLLRAAHPNMNMNTSSCEVRRDVRPRLRHAPRVTVEKDARVERQEPSKTLKAQKRRSPFFRESLRTRFDISFYRG